MSCGVRLESTLSKSEEKRYKAKHSALIKRLAKELHFTLNEVESLSLIYYKLEQQGDKQYGVTKDQFKEVLHSGLDLTDTRLLQRISTALEFDRCVNNTYTLESWIRTFSLFLRGTMDEKLQHCYSVYNMLGNGIQRNTIVNLLNESLIGDLGEDVEDSVRDLTELILIKMDLDRDGTISLEDYRQAVLHQPLCLEAFGRCLPTRLSARAFLTSFTPYFGNVK